MPVGFDISAWKHKNLGAKLQKKSKVLGWFEALVALFQFVDEHSYDCSKHSLIETEIEGNFSYKTLYSVKLRAE